MDMTPLAARALIVAALLAPPAAAQVDDPVTSYRPALAACLEREDLVCAFGVLIDHGFKKEFEPVVVPGGGGATIFGAQLFAVIDRLEERIEPAERREMAEIAVGYAVDAQPDVPYAPGPYMLLLGEICLEQEDIQCAQSTAQSLGFILDANQWYLAGIEDSRGHESTKARAAAFVTTIRERNQ